MSVSITFITAVLDGAAVISDALDSLSNQRQSLDGLTVESIVADGGSRDATREIASRYGFARLLEGGDSGVYHGFNRGIAAATGDYIGFLNADDQLAPGALAALATAISRNQTGPPAVISGAARFQDRNGTVSPAFGCSHAMTAQSAVFAIPAINARLFHRSVFERNGRLDPGIGIAADREFLLRLLDAEPNRIAISAPVAIYREHDASKTIARTSDARHRVWRAELAFADHVQGDPTRYPEAAIAAARRSRALARFKWLSARWRNSMQRVSPSQGKTGTSLPGEPIQPPSPNELAMLPQALLAWRRWRGQLSGY